MHLNVFNRNLFIWILWSLRSLVYRLLLSEESWHGFWHRNLFSVGRPRQCGLLPALSPAMFNQLGFAIFHSREVSRGLFLLQIFDTCLFHKQWVISCCFLVGDFLWQSFQRTLLYFFKGRPKEYDVVWRKGEEKIGEAFVASRLPKDHLVFQLKAHSTGKFRIRFDSHITTHGYDSHSLIINDFTVNEVRDFTISVGVKDEKNTKQWLSRSVLLRHFGESSIFRPNFPPTINDLCFELFLLKKQNTSKV